MTVDVARQNGIESGWHVPVLNYVVSMAKHEIAGTNSCPFETVVDAKQSYVRFSLVPARLPHQLGKPGPDGPGVRKPGQLDPPVSNSQRKCTRLVENEHARMLSQSGVWDSRAFVIPGHNEHGNTAVGQAFERLKRLLDELWADAAPEENISSVNERVEAPRGNPVQDPFVVCKEINTTPPTFYARVPGRVEAQVGVGDETDMNGHPGKYFGVSLGATFVMDRTWYFLTTR